jgi:hypothetical protein
MITRTRGGLAFTVLPRRNTLPKKSSVVMSPEAHALLAREYSRVERKFAEQTEQPEADPQKLFFLRFEMSVLEYHLPELKKGGRA